MSDLSSNIDALISDGVLPIWVYRDVLGNTKLRLYSPEDIMANPYVSMPPEGYKIAFIIKQRTYSNV